ncbi:MAG: extracellular solute-binding protein [Candidatus Dormiibacterota bacterium]
MTPSIRACRDWTAWRTRLLLVVAIGALIVSACGGGPATGGSTAGSSGPPIKLVYFNARSADPVEQALVKKYETLHPNITIQYLSSTSLSGPSDTDAIANLIFNLKAHTTIDVAKVEVSRTPFDLMAAKDSENLSTIDGPAVRSRLSQLQGANMVDFANGVWALPYESDPFGYVYNGTMFQQAGIKHAPTNWNEWRADNKQLKQKFPTSWPICAPIDNLAKTQPLVWGAGGTYWDKDVLPTKATFLNQGMKDAYGFMQEWAANGWMNTSEITTANQVQLMVSHKCAAMDFSASFVQQLKLNDPSTNWGAAPIPAENASHQAENYVGGSALAVPTTSKHPKQALDFILWLTSQQGQNLKWGVDKSLNLSETDITNNQALPASKGTAATLAKDPSWKESLATVHVPVRVSGISPAYSDAYQLLADMQQRILLKRTNVEGELTTTQQQVQQLIDTSVQQNPSLYKR